MNAIITVDNLVKQYKGADKPAVDGISFNIREGEFFAFLGPNGAGKTTTISILTTMLNKTSGDVKIAGFDATTETTQIRKNVGIIFQKPSLDLNLSAEENIRLHACMYGLYGYRPFFSWMPKDYKDRVIELAEIMGIKSSLGNPLRTFSGGMQRKMEIVRSLIHNPKVLFLDEPTQGLDPVARRSLWEHINKTRKQEGTTIFLTTHYIDEAEDVNNVCMVNHGKIQLAGTPEYLKSTLLKKELHLDAADRENLLSELRGMGKTPQTHANYIAVTFEDKTPMAILSNLRTPLTKVKIIEPTLEDAYVALCAEKDVA